MDEAFLSELDKHISNINTDKHWKRKVGNIVLWYSPVDFTQQSLINEILTKSELGPNTLFETKRVTLSNALVGFDDFDLRDYRYAGKAFPVIGRDNKKSLVDLAGFIHHKMARWDNDFIDVAFDVFADLMETHKKETLSDVHFDNLKEPRQELLELESRVAELREQMNLPPLIEAVEVPVPIGSSSSDAEDRERLEEESDTVNEFNPFQSPKTEEPAPVAPPVAPPVPDTASVDVPWPDTHVSSTIPVPRPPSISPSDDELEIIRRKAHKAQPSVEDNTIETPISKIPINAPVINPDVRAQSINPRFIRRT